MGNDCLMRTGDSLRVMKMFWNEKVLTQHCECTKDH